MEQLKSCHWGEERGSTTQENLFEGDATHKGKRVSGSILRVFFLALKRWDDPEGSTKVSMIPRGGGKPPQGLCQLTPGDPLSGNHGTREEYFGKLNGPLES